MASPRRTTEPGRERFGTRLGFIFAAVGSAVGLGNMWRFPYQASEGGGAAFVVAYVFMVFLIGVPMILAEFAAGRSCRQSAIGTARRIGGRAWTPLGLLFLATSAIILSYMSVITGWALRYAFDGAVSGFSTMPAERYAEVSEGPAAIGLHLVAMAVTISIVVFGIRKGIERAGLILMPVLFTLLIGLAIWAATLPNAAEGYRFYLAPSLSEVLDPIVLQSAAAQAFLSLSVGMGIMITYASYLSRETNLAREATIVALADFSVAFVGGLVVFPIVFALGLSEEVGESTMGVLFISLPGAFAQMEAVGRWVGTAFFAALVVAAITSAVSLLEVGTAGIIDGRGWSRKTATIVMGTLVAALGVLPALSQDGLGLMDQLAGELLTVVGVLGMALLVGWVMKSPVEEMKAGASPFMARLLPGAFFLIRWVAPPLLAWIAWLALRQTVAAFAG